MEKILTNAQMREADKYTIESLGVPSLELMERAGKALCETAEKIAPNCKILCVCGGGNNGGDGFVCARLLREKNRDVSVVFFAEKTSVDCAENKEKYLAAGGEILSDIQAENKLSLIVDCLLGTGFHGELTGQMKEIADKINALQTSGVKVLSADIPSGLNGENGIAAEGAVRATHTLCIGEKKTGVCMGDGLDFAGEVLRADIGIALPQEEKTYARLLDKEEIQRLIKPRKRNSHKGTYGKAAIVAGSERYTGAAALALSACLRAGAGYTTLFTPEKLLSAFWLKYPEALLESLNEGGRVAFNEQNFEKLLDYNAVAYGMGMGVSEDVAKGACWLLKHYGGRLILDADGLNSLAKYGKVDEAFAQKKCDVLITPHIKEFSRLTGESVQAILEKGAFAPVAFAKRHGVCVLLKNAATSLTDGQRVCVNVVGTSGQAKGGSGDVLSGVIAGLCASGLSAFDGGKAGAYITGTAAQIAAQKSGEYSLLASDVIAALGQAFLTVLA